MTKPWNDTAAPARWRPLAATPVTFGASFVTVTVAVSVIGACWPGGKSIRNVNV